MRLATERSASGTLVLVDASHGGRWRLAWEETTACVHTSSEVELIHGGGGVRGGDPPMRKKGGRVVLNAGGGSGTAGHAGAARGLERIADVRRSRAVVEGRSRAGRCSSAHSISRKPKRDGGFMRLLWKGSPHEPHGCWFTNLQRVNPK